MAVGRDSRIEDAKTGLFGRRLDASGWRISGARSGSRGLTLRPPVAGRTRLLVVVIVHFDCGGAIRQRRQFVAA